MTNAPNPLSKPIDEKRLRKLLTSRKPADKAELGAWLTLPPPHDPAPLLAEISKDALSSAQVRASFSKGAVVTIVGWLLIYLLTIYHFEKDLEPAGFVGVVGGLLVPSLLAVNTPRAGRQAALLLARTGDTRAVQFLTGLWTPRPLTRRERVFNTNVTRELTRLLSARQGDRYDIVTEDALRGLLKRAFPGKWKWLPRITWRHTADLTEADADLLLCVVRHLSHRPLIGQTRGQLADDAAGRRGAGLGADTGMGEHRTLLRDTAKTLLVGRGKSVQ